MTILKSTAESNGAYINQNGDFDSVPEGYLAIPDELLPAWEQYKPFVTLTVTDGVITAITDNSDARTAAQTKAEAQAAADATAVQITELKEHLVSTDYKVIKCSECSLAGLDAPYDIAELNKERQAIRDQINALEATEAQEGL